MIGGGDGAAGALVLPDRPVLDVVVSAIDRADLVTASIAGDGSNFLTLAAGVVGSIVLENLLHCQARVLRWRFASRKGCLT